MKQIDIGNTIQVLANVGVIAGIALLAIEMRQNNSLLEAQAGYALAENRASNYDLLKTSPEFATFISKLAAGGELTPVEHWRERGLYMSFIVRFSWEFSEYRAGRLRADQLPTVVWGRLIRGEGPLPTPGMRDVWEDVKFQFDPEFIQFIESEVIPKAGL